MCSGISNYGSFSSYLDKNALSYLNRKALVTASIFENFSIKTFHPKDAQ